MRSLRLPLALLVLCVRLAAAEFFVAPDGDDRGPGSREAPFASLEGARDAIRARKGDGGLPEGGTTVTLLGGTYRRTATFALEARDSGTPASPVVYRAEPGKEVRLTGGREVRGFAPVRDPRILARLPENSRSQVRQADLRAEGIADFGVLEPRGMGLPQRPAALEVFAGDRPMPLARWPNEGFVRTGEVIDTGSKVFSRGGPQGFINPHRREEPRPGAFVFAESRLARWTEAKDIWVHGYWGRDWSSEHLPVAAIDAEKHTVHMGHPTRYGHYPDKRFYFLNLLEELDQPGEWYLDRETGLLYFWPPEPPAATSVSLLSVPLLALRNVSHVALRGLVFEQTRTNAIEIREGEGVLLAGCTVRNIGSQAIRVTGGRNHAVIGCDIMDIGDGGIVLQGGSRRTLEPGGHRAENNHIARFGRWCRTYRPAISLQGAGNSARHNLIHDSAHIAVTMGGNDHVFEFNEVHSVVRETTDSGALYTGGNPTCRGNVIRHNYWHHIGSGLRHSGQAAIYLDDGLSGTRVVGNLFYRVGGAGVFGATNVHGGKDNVFENNAFVDCRLGLSFHTWSAKVWQDFLASGVIRRAFEAVDAEGPLYRERYPELAVVAGNPGQNIMRRNLLYRCERIFHERPEGRTRNEQNLLTDENPGFAQPEQGDFRMAEPVPDLAELGFEPIPFARIGLRPDLDRASWPVVHAPLAVPEPEPAPPPRTAARPPAPVFAVHRTDRNPSIDGHIGEGEWGTTERVMPIAERPDGKPVLPPSHAWAVHDGQNLLLAVSIPLNGKEARTGQRWRDDDAVELALRGPGGADAPILVLRGYAGGHFEASAEAGAPAETVARLNREVGYAARVRGTDGWTAEWRLPFAALGGIRLVAGTPLRLPFSLTVRQTAGPVWQMWRGTHGYSWLVDRAGILELVP